jgi:hypothetical protein
MMPLLSANAGPLQPFSAGRLQREPVGSHSIPLLDQKTIGFEELANSGLLPFPARDWQVHRRARWHAAYLFSFSCGMITLQLISVHLIVSETKGLPLEVIE